MGEPGLGRLKLSLGAWLRARFVGWRLVVKAVLEDASKKTFVGGQHLRYTGLALDLRLTS